MMKHRSKTDFAIALSLHQSKRAEVVKDYIVTIKKESISGSQRKMRIM
ncbi:hypothetical protein LCY76_14650 [Fictibacillus sp. KIGAM418]|uniref:Uncharacterized protein n=1 Tax=Fictibacillus marinisediminis TaxID=2878389 RepID=A0A9X1XCZ3_9BACL|nr:hypothetical protein [Fictibacillus marinisediminis]MCK6257821.1 hypothetical protein [Fictibacillus marinisediminis]